MYIDNLANRQINQRLKDKLNNPNGGIGIKLGTAYGTDFQLGNENLFYAISFTTSKKSGSKYWSPYAAIDNNANT